MVRVFLIIPEREKHFIIFSSKKRQRFMAGDARGRYLIDLVISQYYNSDGVKRLQQGQMVRPCGLVGSFAAKLNAARLLALLLALVR